MLSLSATLVLAPLQGMTVASAAEFEVSQNENFDEVEIEEGTVFEEEPIDEAPLSNEEPEIQEIQAAPAKPANLDGIDGAGREAVDKNDPEETNPVVETREEVREESIPFETQYIEDDSISEGEQVVSQTGIDGVYLRTYEVTVYEDGTIEEELINESTTDATPQIILVGTQVVEEPVDPEPEPEEPTEPAPEPTPEEPEPEESEEPILAVNAIYPNAQSITGYANPNANVVVFYPGTNRQRSATVNGNGYWQVRNIGGDASSLTEGSTVPMLLIHNGEEHYYEDQFYVQSEDGTPDDYSANTEVSENSSEADNMNTDNATDSATDSAVDSDIASSTLAEDEAPQLLPETGESENPEFLGFASLATGLGLMVVGKKKTEKDME